MALVVVDLGPAGKVARGVDFSDANVVRFSWVNNTRLVFSVADLETGSGEDATPRPACMPLTLTATTCASWWLAGREAVVVEGGRSGREALPYNQQLLHVPLPEPGVENDEIIVGTLVFDGRNDLTQVVPQWLATCTSAMKVA